MNRRILLGTVLATICFAAGSTVAFAAFDDGATAAQTLGTDAVDPPTAPSAGLGTCTLSVTDRLVITWDTTASAWADGYEILRSLVPGGPYIQVAAVAGQGTTSWIDDTVTWVTTYHYVVRATKHEWDSAITAEVVETTRSALCV